MEKSCKRDDNRLAKIAKNREPDIPRPLGPPSKCIDAKVGQQHRTGKQTHRIKYRRKWSYKKVKKKKKKKQSHKAAIRYHNIRNRDETRHVWDKGTSLSETTEIGVPRRISEKILDKQIGTSADQSKVEDINKWIQK